MNDDVKNMFAFVYPFVKYGEAIGTPVSFNGSPNISDIHRIGLSDPATEEDTNLITQLYGSIQQHKTQLQTKREQAVKMYNMQIVPICVLLLLARDLSAFDKSKDVGNFIKGLEQVMALNGSNNTEVDSKLPKYKNFILNLKNFVTDSKYEYLFLGDNVPPSHKEIIKDNISNQLPRLFETLRDLKNNITNNNAQNLTLIRQRQGKGDNSSNINNIINNNLTTIQKKLESIQSQIPTVPTIQKQISNIIASKLNIRPGSVTIQFDKLTTSGVSQVSQLLEDGNSDLSESLQKFNTIYTNILDTGSSTDASRTVSKLINELKELQSVTSLFSPLDSSTANKNKYPWYPVQRVISSRGTNLTKFINSFVKPEKPTYTFHRGTTSDTDDGDIKASLLKLGAVLTSMLVTMKQVPPNHENLFSQVSQLSTTLQETSNQYQTFQIQTSTHGGPGAPTYDDNGASEGPDDFDYETQNEYENEGDEEKYRQRRFDLALARPSHPDKNNKRPGESGADTSRFLRRRFDVDVASTFNSQVRGFIDEQKNVNPANALKKVLQ
ncbi:MAG: hypothetical protein ABEI52_08575, partial [Halobacteriaceae archaeon]